MAKKQLKKIAKSKSGFIKGLFVAILLVFFLFNSVTKIVEGGLLQWAKKNGTLVGSIVGLLVIVLIAFLYKKRSNELGNRLKSIEKTMGEKQLFEKLGRDKLVYPIIGIGGDWAESVQIKTANECYKKFIAGEFASGDVPAYVVDADQKKWSTTKVRLSELGVSYPELKDIYVYKIEDTGETVDMSDLKKLVSGGVYKNLEAALAESKSVSEITEIMGKGQF